MSEVTGQADLTKLREILFLDERKRISSAEERLGALDEKILTLVSPESVGSVLPEAVKKSLNDKSSLAMNLQPIIEDGLGTSIIQHKKKMVDILFPIIAPAVRKIVSESINNLIQKLDSIIEAATSLRAIKWRIESIRTGVPVSLIALRHSLVFRVEHIFLIRNKTGRLIYHLQAANAIETDKWTFAGMFEAINEFVLDCFGKPETTGIDTLDLGEVKVLFEESQFATVAAVVQPKIFVRVGVF